MVKSQLVMTSCSVSVTDQKRVVGEFTGLNEIIQRCDYYLVVSNSVTMDKLRCDPK